MNVQQERKQYNCYEVETVLGLFLIYYNDEGIYRLVLPSKPINPGYKSHFTKGANHGFPWPALESELKLYGKGRIIRGTYPLLNLGYSEWTKNVLQATLSIPFGETRSYKQIAEQLGRPSAARAVGRAVSCNRTPILIPCHRVVGQKGHLVGFSSGLLWKQRLLDLEQHVP